MMPTHSAPDLRCPLCVGDAVALRPGLMRIIRSEFESSTVATCDSCHLSFLTPMPSLPDLEGMYEQDYFEAYRDQQIALPAGCEWPPERYRNRLAEVQGQRGVGSLLEIGPGHGAFLHFARLQGWQVVGLETSRYAAERARVQYGIDILHGTLTTSNLRDEQFDVVHMSHVLEHLPNPIESLTVVRRVLKPGGVLIIEVPNEFRSLQFRLLNLVGLMRPYSVKCTHLFFFDPSTLSRVLLMSGFAIRRVTTVRDLEGGSRMRQIGRRIAYAVEHPFDVAPLIEAVAIKLPSGPGAIHPVA